MTEKIKKNKLNKKVNNKKKRISSKTKISKEKELIKTLNDEIIKIKDSHLRLKAEFDNFRRRKVDEFAKLLQYEGEDVIKGFIPIIDDLDRIIISSDSSEKLLKDGIKLVKTKIDKFLSSLEVKSFAKKGDKMDIDLHDAMMTKTEKKLDNNSIIEVFEKGYKYKDKVIRHAKVIVNKK